MAKRKTHEDFVKEVRELVGDDYKVISEYVGVKIPIEFKHKCGKTITKTPDKFLHKKRFCPECDGTPEVWGDTKYKSFVMSEGKGDYEVLGIYNGMSKPITLCHTVCGHEYTASARVFREGGRCPKCAYLDDRGTPTSHNKLSHEEFISRLSKKQLEEFDVITKYTGSSNRIEIKCKACGAVNTPISSSLLKGNGGCRHCAIEKSKKTKQKQFRNAFNTKVESESQYEILSNYKNAITDVLFRHKECGNTYYQKPREFVSGNRCPICASSKGEKKIQYTLDSIGVPYEKEYKFDDLKYKYKLRFDFAVFNENGGLDCLIEFDGKHHFEEIPFFKSNKLDVVQARDGIKNDYCVENNIKLIRIPYYEFDNIENILAKEVSGF